MSEFRHEVIEEDDRWVYGKTFQNGSFFGKWCRFKKGGNAPTLEQLTEIEEKRALNAEDHRKNNPSEPSKDYFEACKRWPLKRR